MDRRAACANQDLFRPERGNGRLLEPEHLGWIPQLAMDDATHGTLLQYLTGA
jgi:hypothetical protein